MGHGDASPPGTEPVLPGPGDSDYERYLRTDELLALQKPPDERVHRDELLFTTVHQSSELWLKFAVSELEHASELVGADQPLEACRMLRRVVRALRFITDQLDMLDEMDPWDYNFVRSALGHGSGFDSPGFRAIARATARIGAALDGALERAGITLEQLYHDRLDHQRLHELAELLTDFDERLRLWRFRHYSVVARAIGEESIGIQGVEVQQLQKLIAQRQFPKLWQVRTRLVDRFEDERDRTD